MDSHRLFIAAYPPPSVTDALLAAAALMHADMARPVPREQVHLTLLFIGSVRRIETAHLVESMDRAVSGRGAGHITFSTITCLPESGEPRLLAAMGEADGTVIEIQKRFASRLARFRPRADRERFSPHITMARFPPGTPRPGSTPIKPIVWRICRIQLMSSHLRQEGAVHTPIHTADLDT